MPSPDTMDRVIGWSCAVSGALAIALLLAESAGWIA